MTSTDTKESPKLVSYYYDITQSVPFSDKFLEKLSVTDEERIRYAESSETHDKLKADIDLSLPLIYRMSIKDDKISTYTFIVRIYYLPLLNDADKSFVLNILKNQRIEFENSLKDKTIEIDNKAIDGMYVEEGDFVYKVVAIQRKVISLRLCYFAIDHKNSLMAFNTVWNDLPIEFDDIKVKHLMIDFNKI